MAFQLPMRFPSEAEALRKQLQADRHLTPQQRLAAVADALAAADALSHAGGLREAQLKYNQDQEDEWRRRMKEFIAKHARS